MIPAVTSTRSVESDQTHEEGSSLSTAYSLCEAVTKSLRERFRLGFYGEIKPLRPYGLPVPGVIHEAPAYYPLEPSDGYVIELSAFGYDSYQDPHWRSAPLTFIGTITVTGKTPFVDLNERQFDTAAKEAVARYLKAA
ncbi:MAG: hypothetical protein ACMXYM_04145 [Candidatus Woesearchaeota archaeon]